MDFFTKYESLCQQVGKSPNAVAKELHIPSSSVTNWKQGKRPRIDAIQKISSYFNVSIDYLVSDTDEKKPTQTGELVNDDAKLTALLERARNDPHIRMLFSLTADASSEDVEKAIKILQMLKE